MAKSKKTKPVKRKSHTVRVHKVPIMPLYEIPLQIINWLGKTPGKHCLVVLQVPDGSAYSVELYDVPVAAGDAIVGTAQDENLQRAFNGAMANYNLQAAAKGRQDYIV